jgi:hypothetical protein
MSASSVGRADLAVPTTTTPDELSLGRALEMCDRALDRMEHLQRAKSVDPNHFQSAVAAVQAVRTELIKSRLLASGGIV